MFPVQLKRLAIAISLLVIPSLLNAQSMSIERVATGLSQPLVATCVPGDATRLYIAERSGTIKILNLTSGNVTTFMTVPGVDTNFEGGLLGLAFHPDFMTATEKYFYVNFTEWTGTDRTRIVRYTATDADTASSATAQQVLEFNQPQQNHNGGWIGFSPIDEYLYIATGDGGNFNDTGTGHSAGGNAQDITNNLLGKMLRLDVDGDDFPGDATRNYAIPPDNTFVGVSGDDEIFLYGLRNPWRCSFDRLNGDLYIGDVGQNAREEIDVYPGAGHPDRNMGWRLREGTIQTPSAGIGGPRPTDNVDPIYDYPRVGLFGGTSCTGGYVYRGKDIADFQGLYFFTDHNSNTFWSIRFDGSDPSTFDGTNFTSLRRWNNNITIDAGSIFSVASMGEDDEGNLYILDRTGGEIFKIVDGSLFTDGTLSMVLPINGTYQSGSEADLDESDGNTMDYSSVVPVSGPAIDLWFFGSVPMTNPDLLRFNLESQVTTPNLTQTIELYNFLTDGFEVFDTRTASTSNELVTVEVEDTANYTDVNGDVRARVTLTADGPVTGFPWTLKMDQAGWQILE